MEVYKLSELCVAFSCVAGGAALGVDFDLLRALRRTVPGGKAAAAVLDLLFWLSAALIVYLCIYISNDAQLRWFEFIGFAVGFALYMRFFSRKCLAVLCAVAAFALKFFCLAARLVSLPFSLCAEWLKKAANAYYSAKSGALYKSHKLFSKTRRKIRAFGKRIAKNHR